MGILDPKFRPFWTKPIAGSTSTRCVSSATGSTRSCGARQGRAADHALSAPARRSEARQGLDPVAGPDRGRRRPRSGSAPRRRRLRRGDGRCLRPTLFQPVATTEWRCRRRRACRHGASALSMNGTRKSTFPPVRDACAIRSLSPTAMPSTATELRRCARAAAKGALRIFATNAGGGYTRLELEVDARQGRAFRVRRHARRARHGARIRHPHDPRSPEATSNHGARSVHWGTATGNFLGGSTSRAMRRRRMPRRTSRACCSRSGRERECGSAAGNLRRRREMRARRHCGPA